MAIPDPGAGNYALLTLAPLSTLDIDRSFNLKLLARLACLIHAANVHSEPGSNPSIGFMHQQYEGRRIKRLLSSVKEPFEVFDGDLHPTRQLLA